MSIRNASDADLRSLVKWSPRFADEAQRELDRRAAERHAAEVDRDRAEAGQNFKLQIQNQAGGCVFPNGRWS